MQNLISLTRRVGKSMRKKPHGRGLGRSCRVFLSGSHGSLGWRLAWFPSPTVRDHKICSSANQISPCPRRISQHLPASHWIKYSYVRAERKRLWKMTNQGNFFCCVFSFFPWHFQKSPFYLFTSIFMQAQSWRSWGQSYNWHQNTNRLAIFFFISIVHNRRNRAFLPPCYSTGFFFSLGDNRFLFKCVFERHSSGPSIMSGHCSVWAPRKQWHSLWGVDV